MSELAQLKDQEHEAWLEFVEACRDVLVKREAIGALHDPVYHAGGDPLVLPMRAPDAVDGCKQFIAQLEAHERSKAAAKAAKAAGPKQHDRAGGRFSKPIPLKRLKGR